MAEKRIILTRDRQLLKDRRVIHGYWIRSQFHIEQLTELFVKFDLRACMHLFTRCITCNTPLEEVSKEEVADRLLAGTSRYYSKFNKCPGCNRIYWEGSHYDNMKVIVNNVIRKVEESYEKNDI